MSDCKKFRLQCSQCRFIVPDFLIWFASGQKCPECGAIEAEVVYDKGISALKTSWTGDSGSRTGMWRYFNLLPLKEPKNIVSCGEGEVAIDRWTFLEEIALRNFNIHCQIYAHRQDNNFATGTFKDLAGSVVASVLKENGVREYVVASTGNIGVACARYLSDANITLYAFIPENSSRSQEAEIACFGQKVFRVKGDYSFAKQLAAEFASKHKILLAAGNFDPMRIEAKKTMLFEWLRVLDVFPSVYIQALSGGTGPLGIRKGIQDLHGSNLSLKLPRLLLIQSDKCSPMADAWQDARLHGFPSGWEQSYPVYNNPQTRVPTLATGNPKTYPVLGKLVRESGGEILRFWEDDAALVARLVAYKTSVRIGPAAAIAVGGLLTALKKQHIRDSDIVMLNIGEGIRRAPEFMNQMTQATATISNSDDCVLIDRCQTGEELLRSIEMLVHKD